MRRSRNAEKQSARCVRSILAGVTAVALLTVTAGAALADQLRDNVTVDGNDTITLNGATGSTTLKYWIHEAGTCDAADGSAALVTVNVPAAVTKSPAGPLTFTACGGPNGVTNFQEVTFTSGTVGQYPITVSITDSFGNYNGSHNAFTLKVVRQNTAPTVTVTGVAAGASYEKGSVPAASCQVNDVEQGATTFAATLSPVTGSLSTYGLGSQTASCTHTDAGGLSGSDSKTYAIVDTKKPQLSLPGDITQEATGPAGATVDYTPAATDAVDPAPVVDCSPASGSSFALGTKAVICSATDAAGNTAEGMFNVTVQDTTKPVLNLPAGITKEATGPNGAAATYSVSASDAVDTAVMPICSPVSGSTFALGVNPVGCTATDASDNQVAGGFNVSVVDTTPPVLILPAVSVEATGPAGAVATFSASAVDVVTGASVVSCDSPSGTTFSLGTTTVNCSATDGSNEAYGSFVVTVTDITPPALQLPENIEREATKPQGADVSFSTSASDLVDGSVPVTCVPATGGTFEIGATTVACEATDTAGNTGAGEFIVTVNDTTPPSIADMPADQLLEATGPSGATATFDLPTATDVVDGARTVSCSPASGTVFGITTTTVTCSAADTLGHSASRSFDVTVVDTTPPAVTVPDNIVEEATSADGAVVSWSGVSAIDIVDGAVAASCNATSGATFALGVHTVTCSVTDAARNTGSNSFTVSVNDTRAPVVTVPADMKKEATGPSGAVVTWTGVSAEDVVDGKNLEVDCEPPSGSTLALGDTTVTCTSTDKARNAGSGAFVVTVEDTTAPDLTVPADTTKEATSAAGAAFTYTPAATDAVDTDVMVDCGDTPSGHVFPLGSPTTVTCTATDDAGNSAVRSFTVTVVDTTAPAITVPGPQTLEATSADGAVATYTASASDLVDGDVTAQCSPPSGGTFALGTTTVTCTAVDARNNPGSQSFTVKVQDTTAPTVNVPANMTVQATSAAGAPVTYSATATDIVDGAMAPVCSPASGATFKPGPTTVTCSATDSAGNAGADGTFTVTVSFSHTGFLAPVDGNKVLNGMKAGSTAPIKWQVPNGTGGFIGDLSIVSRMLSGVISCTAGAMLDDLEVYTTGNTALRYDASANQFIYNWQSPKSAGKCYSVRITLTDGSELSATFQLR